MLTMQREGRAGWRLDATGLGPETRTLRAPTMRAVFAEGADLLEAALAERVARNVVAITREAEGEVYEECPECGRRDDHHRDDCPCGPVPDEAVLAVLLRDEAIAAQLDADGATEIAFNALDLDDSEAWNRQFLSGLAQEVNTGSVLHGGAK